VASENLLEGDRISADELMESLIVNDDLIPGQARTQNIPCAAIRNYILDCLTPNFADNQNVPRSTVKPKNHHHLWVAKGTAFCRLSLTGLAT
jgi:hypothetical protein